MSRLLAELLGAPQPAFTQALHKLEQASGQPSVDVRLTAEMVQKAQAAIKTLGLDPRDTTTRELYQALMLQVERDEKRLRKQLDLSDTTSLDKIVPQVVKSLDALNLPRTAWALKPSVVKRLLKANPPKLLMKRLGYRSIDSLLKRESIAAVLLAAELSEGRTWRERLYTKYRQLKASDFEMTEVEIVMLNSVRWQHFFEGHEQLRHRLIVSVPELAALVVLPLEATVLPGAALALLLSLVYHLNQVRSISAHVKLQQVKPHFGQLALDIWKGQAKPLAHVGGQPLYWGVVHRHLSQHPASHYPTAFDPHVQPEDLHHHTPEEILVAIDPDLGFWQLTSHCGISHDGQAVSMHALDAAVSYCNQLPFENRSLGYIQEALGQELLARYLREPRLNAHITQQLETQIIAPELSLEVVA